MSQGCQTIVKCYKCAWFYIAVRNVSIFPNIHICHIFASFLPTQSIWFKLNGCCWLWPWRIYGRPPLGKCELLAFHLPIYLKYIFFAGYILPKKFNYLVFKCLPLRSHLNMRSKGENLLLLLLLSAFFWSVRAPSRKHISSRAFVVEFWSADSLYSRKETISRKFNFWYKLYNIQTES